MFVFVYCILNPKKGGFITIQKIRVQGDSFKIFEQYLRLALGTALDGDGSAIAVKVADLNDIQGALYLPTRISEEYFPVILIEGWFTQKQNEKPHNYFDGCKPWNTFVSSSLATDFVLGEMRKNGSGWIEQFEKAYGTGYGCGFGHKDGVVSVGYELSSYHDYPRRLSVSLVHIYERHGE